MLLSKNLNQNMLKMRYIFLKKKNRQALEAPSSDPCSLTHTNYTTTNVQILSPIKSPFWLPKFGAILVPPLFVLLPFHFTWSGQGT